MSKARLKKEISGYPAEQLVELILDAYDAKMPARDYFEFYLNPDVPAITDKARRAIEKEMARTRRMQARFRISAIKKQIALLKAYRIDPREIADLMLVAVEAACRLMSLYKFPDTQQRAIAHLLADMMEYCDRNEILDRYLEPLHRALEGVSPAWGNRAFLRELREQFANYTPFDALK